MRYALPKQRDSSGRFARGFLMIGRAAHVAANSVPKVNTLFDLSRQPVFPFGCDLSILSTKYFVYNGNGVG